MDETTKHLIAQLGTLGIQMFFSWMQQSGKTEEEIEQMYAAEKAKFLARDPKNLPKPPK